MRPLHPAVSRILRMPDDSAALWRPYERMLREWASAGGSNPPEQVDALLAVLRPVFIRHARAANEHPTAQDPHAQPLDQVQAWVAQLTFGLLREIALREIAMPAIAVRTAPGELEEAAQC